MEKRIQDIRDKLARAVRAQRVCMFVQDSKANLTSDEEKWITTKKGEKGGGQTLPYRHRDRRYPQRRP